MQTKVYFLKFQMTVAANLECRRNNYTFE